MSHDPPPWYIMKWTRNDTRPPCSRDVTEQCSRPDDVGVREALVSGQSPREQNGMVDGQAVRENESGSIVNRGANGSGAIDGTQLADELGPIPSFPPLALDPETGRILPVSDEELAARRDAALRMLAVLDQITDESDTDEKWREVYRNIDACRPHRPLFTGLY